MARRFGIEIEFGGSISAACAAIRDAGLGDGQEYPYNRNATGGLWTVKRDGSVQGGELVSPILDIDNPADREQVTKAVMALRAAGCTTHASAGIHVHIDGTTLTPEQVVAVARVYTKFEDCIYRVASSGWDGMRPSALSQYAKPMPREVAEKISKAKSVEQVARAYYQEGTNNNLAYRQQNHHDGARYYGLNLHSWFYRKTIEFRVFNSSLNPERIQGYIGMCMAIVQDAKNGFRRSINKRYALGDMAAGRANEASARHRFLQVLRYDGQMDLEDMKRLTKIWKDSKPVSYSSY